MKHLDALNATPAQKLTSLLGKFRKTTKNIYFLKKFPFLEFFSFFRNATFQRAFFFAACCVFRRFI